MRIAILLTSHNRKDLTMRSLESLYLVVNNLTDCHFNVFLVDDKSTDNTPELIKQSFPNVNIIEGTGSLYWAGGMRLAWETAIKNSTSYDGYLLINDDVEFLSDFWDKIEMAINYSLQVYGREGIYTLSTKDKETGKITYGGHDLRNKWFKHSTYIVIPSEEPQECQLTNANILFVSQNVVDVVGILDSHFTHSLADFDYSLTVKEKGFPVLVCPGYGGYCSNDHPENLLGERISLRNRIRNLCSVKGIALNEYLYYLKKHFAWKVAYAFLVLWIRTLFPQFMKE